MALVVLLGVPAASLALAGRSPQAGGTPASAATDPVLAVGGDIACDIGQVPSATECQQGATANLVTAMHPDAVLPLGDTQYDNATAAAYSQMYDPSWGQVKSISHPVVGNHEYNSAGAAPYFTYFGSAAGTQAGGGYYSWNLGAWHLIALNSECNSAPAAGCAAGSTQEQWLRNDLAANAGKCILAYWHEPRFSSGNGGSNSVFQPFWQDLYNAHADVVLNGHTHAYERFAPQSPTGAADAAGPREFVVGTGGVNMYGFSAALSNEQVRQNSTFGVMKMVLHPTSYDWQFVPTAGSSFTDSGTTTCHASSPAAPAAPTGLRAGTVTTSQVPLSWTASSSTGMAGYRVYRGTSTTPLNSSLVTTTAYTDSTVAAGTSYSYTVTAVNTSGVESARSASVSVTTPAGGVVNGGFESNSLSGWTATGTTSVAATGHTGGYSALLGSTSPTGESSIAQTFTAPAGTTGLSFWWSNSCPDKLSHDWATATLRDNTTGFTTTPLPRTCIRSSAWTQVTAAVTSGHSYTLTLANHDDGHRGDASYTRYDDVALN